MLKFFVTPEGLSAAIRNQSTCYELRAALLNSSARRPRKMLALGYLAEEQRKVPRQDTTALLVSGAVDQVAHFMRRPSGLARATGPRVVYRVTRRSLPARLGPSLLAVYHAAAKQPAGVTHDDLYQALPNMDRNTLRWAVQVLRQRHLLRTDHHVSEDERTLLASRAAHSGAFTKAS